MNARLAKSCARYRSFISSLPSFDILNLLAEPLDRALEIEAEARQFHIGRLGAEGIGLPVEFLAQKVEAAPNRAATFEELPRGGRIRSCLKGVGTRPRDKELFRSFRRGAFIDSAADRNKRSEGHDRLG